MKDILRGLAFIVTFAAPMRTAAFMDGDGNIRAGNDPQYTRHSCRYKGYELLNKCDDTGRCFVAEAYDGQGRRVHDLRPLHPTCLLELDQATGICRDIPDSDKYCNNPFLCC